MLAGSSLSATGDASLSLQTVVETNLRSYWFILDESNPLKDEIIWIRQDNPDQVPKKKSDPEPTQKNSGSNPQKNKRPCSSLKIQIQLII